MDEIIYKPIGIIHTPHTNLEKIPIQPVFAKGITGEVEVYEEFSKGIRDLHGFSHIYLFYFFHKAYEVNLLVKPFMEDVNRGVFATRAPTRPNKIGMSIVKLNAVKDSRLFIENVDMLDGTPLLDIKPYTAKFDSVNVLQSGWQDEISDDVAHTRGKREYEK